MFAYSIIQQVFEFAIDGKPDKCKLVISGTVVPPTFAFSVDKIRFGQVSYGFKYTHACSLRNTSLVPMAFSLRVASDCETRDGSAVGYDAVNSQLEQQWVRDLLIYLFVCCC